LRGSTIVEAMVALALGLGAGAAYLVATGELPGQDAIQRLGDGKAAAQKRLDDHASEKARIANLQADFDAELKRREGLIKASEEAARAAAAAAEAEAAKAAEAARAAEAAKVVVEKLPAFGLLAVKAVSGDLSVEAGPGKGGKGKAVDVPFDAAPAPVKLAGGKFKIDLKPRLEGKALVLDVAVQPMAIITADGNRVGTSAQGLRVERKAFNLDFQSPVAGELKLLLTFKK
jgi:hypothetical protein